MLPVHVISLADAQRRRAKIAAVLDAQQWPWSFSDAVDGRHLGALKDYFDSATALKFPGYPLTDNEIACFLSHRALWEKCLERHESIIVMEDDALPCAELLEEKIGEEESLVGKIARIPLENIDILRLINTDMNKGGEYRVLREMGDFSVCRYRRNPLGAQAYILTPQGAEKLLAGGRRFSLSLDNYIWRTDLHGAVLYDVLPFFFRSDDEGVSTIGRRQKPHMGLLKKIRVEFYRAVERKRQVRMENRIFNHLPPL